MKSKSNNFSLPTGTRGPDWQGWRAGCGPRAASWINNKKVTVYKERTYKLCIKYLQVTSNLLTNAYLLKLLLQLINIWGRNDEKTNLTRQYSNVVQVRWRPPSLLHREVGLGYTLGVCLWRYFENRSTFAKVMTKIIKMYLFFSEHGVYQSRIWPRLSSLSWS